jgi:hypothetical protein
LDAGIIKVYTVGAASRGPCFRPPPQAGAIVNNTTNNQIWKPQKKLQEQLKKIIVNVVQNINVVIVIYEMSARSA